MLVVLVALSLVAAHLHGRMLLVREQYRDVHVQSLVDAGIAHAMAQIYDRIAYDETERLELDDGEVVVEVSIAGVQRRWVDVWARYRGEERSLRVEVFIEEAGALPKVEGLAGRPPGDSPFAGDPDDSGADLE